MLLSGDWIPVPLPDQVRQGWPDAAVVALGGATEATIWSNVYRVGAVDPRWPSIPYGRPIPQARYYVLTPTLAPCPIGVRGDLYIGGAVLAIGYLGDARQTAARFVPDPFAATPGARLYRTGDCARWRDDGQLEFLGRVDDQVKIRGYRIELGEIETAIRKHPQVQDAVVKVHGDGEERRLVAYTVRRRTQQEQRQARAVKLEEWQQVWDAIYREGKDHAWNFNTAGWQSSYTNQPIPADEMRIWVDETVSHLRRFEASSILEIGCGTGLLLTRLAGTCERYIGIDSSQEVIEQLEALVATQFPDRRIELRQAQADQLSFLTNDSVDLVVLNSVIQYFPDVDYLLSVLQAARRVVKPGGRIFVGDVRSLPLWRAFHTSVQLFRAGDDTSWVDLQQRIDQAQRNDKELVVDPRLFVELGRRSDKGARVELWLKGGAYDNELSRFRYDVVMHIGAPEVIGPPHAWLTWDTDGQWRDGVVTASIQQPDRAIGVRGIPDARVAAAVTAFSRQLNVGLAWRGFGDDGLYEVVFNPQWVSAEPLADVSDSYYQRFANAPLQSAGDRNLGPVLRDIPARDAAGAHGAGRVRGARRAAADGQWQAGSAGAARARRGPGDRGDVCGAAHRGGRAVVPDLGARTAGDAGRRRRQLLRAWRRSDLSIQIAAAAREAGLQVTVQQIFRSQTVAALADQVSSGVALVAAPAEGPAPLTPIQAWFFGLELAESWHFNQSVLLRVPAAVDADDVAAALDVLARQHDAWRLRFTRQADGQWTQAYAAAAPIPLELIDLRGLADEATRRTQVAAAAERLQAGLDLTAGPMVRAGWFELDAGERRLLLVAHHLVTDGVSWRIVLADLQQLCAQRLARQPLALPYRSTPYDAWAQRLHAWVGTEALAAEMPHWQTVVTSPAPPLPRACAASAIGTEASVQTVQVQLSVAETTSLLTDVPKASRTSTPDVLVTALVRSIAQWTGQAAVRLELEGHGRDELFEDVDLTRTVGWFTTIYPVAVQLTGRGVGEDLAAVKMQLRAVRPAGWATACCDIWTRPARPPSPRCPRPICSSTISVSSITS